MSVIIGIDPHKATHTAVAIDRGEQPVATLQVADRCQTQRLLTWAGLVTHGTARGAGHPRGAPPQPEGAAGRVRSR
jgi:hypothetical protein